ncbi:uncharacterized protein LOC143593292 [Bidens hawaiensis]|uniref:uncharacterized protein LOC143593292 n=1 Tax=Bidens hawaiensis TaxID=980011 RepID=UPI00404AB6C1
MDWCVYQFMADIPLPDDSSVSSTSINNSDSEMENNTLISKLDFGDSLYLHPSDTSNLAIVNLKLTGTENYSMWSNSMELALLVKNKLGFVDGTCVKPVGDDALSKQWERCNSIVLSWILNSISEELYVGQIFSKVVSVVWQDLKETYQKIDSSVIFNLHKKITTLNQSGSSVSDYYHKLNSMWHQFDSMANLPTCTCGAAHETADFNQRIKLMQFLMGLDDMYQLVRSNVLIKDPLPSVKNAFAIISSEESHRSIISNNKTNATVFVAKTFDNKRKFAKNQIVKCSHCNKNGHPIEKCFELIGYPESYKRKENFKNNSSNLNKYDLGTNIGSNVASSTHTFSTDEVAKLLALISEKKNEETLDNMADLNLSVKHPNGTFAKIEKIGNLKLSDNVVLHDVLVVPDYYVNLLSVFKLSQDNKVGCSFDEFVCYVQDSLQKKILMIGKPVDGLYFFEDISRDSLKIFDFFVEPDESPNDEERDLDQHDHSNNQPPSGPNVTAGNLGTKTLSAINNEMYISLDNQEDRCSTSSNPSCPSDLRREVDESDRSIDESIESNEDLYMTLPEGFFNKYENKVCKLVKSLYGLKQAPRKWNEKLTQVLLDDGFKQSISDYSLFVKYVNNVIVVLLVYVDDIVLTGNDENEIRKVKLALSSCFKIKDLGILKYFLGIEVLRSELGITLCQRKYCLELLASFGMIASKPISTPIEQIFVVTDKANSDKNDFELKNVTEYQKLIGKLIYLTLTRPDIAYTVHCLSQFMHSPLNSHLQVALRLLRYLKGSPGKGVLIK